MSTTKTTPMQSLADYIYDELKIEPIKTKSGKGYMLFDLPTIFDLQTLTSLVSAADDSWKTSYFEPEYDKGNKTKNASVYFGTKQNKNSIKKDAFLSSK